MWLSTEADDQSSLHCVTVLTDVMPMLVLYRDSVDNTVEENSSVFSLIQMCWLPSARACGQ